jgi:hypothetical protein
VERLRDLVAKPELNNPSLQAWCVASLMELTVMRFERLIESGKLDSELPKLSSLPMLYSPVAGKGAAAWLKAKNLYQAKKVGKKGLLEFRGRDPYAARVTVWGELAELGVRVALGVSGQLPAEIHPRKERAEAVFICERRRPAAKVAVRSTIYLLNDGGVLWCPDWLLFCEGLPRRVEDATTAYKRAVRAMLSDFFADPGNKLADKILEPLIANRSGNSRSDAVKQAKKQVLSCVGRL